MQRVCFLQRTTESSSVLGSGETSCLVTVTNPITQPKAYVAERSAAVYILRRAQKDT